jgi:outer membrane lipoprotein-sorting protein
MKKMDSLQKLGMFCIFLLVSSGMFSQNSKEAKSLLDEVSAKMTAYNNMLIDFSQTLVNEDAGIKKGDEPPIRGEIVISGEKYQLEYLGNTFLFDGKKLHVINHDEKEIAITKGDLDSDDGFIYPSKLFTFYKEGYQFEMGKLQNINGRNIQFVMLRPIDSSSEIVKVELGIDAKTKHIFNLIQTGANGSKTTFTITKFKSNEPLATPFFTFDRQKFLAKKYRID